MISYNDISDIENVQICARWTKAYNTDSSNNAPENLNNLSIISIDDDIIHDYDGLEIVTSRKDDLTIFFFHFEGVPLIIVCYKCSIIITMYSHVRVYMYVTLKLYSKIRFVEKP